MRILRDYWSYLSPRRGPSFLFLLFFVFAGILEASGLVLLIPALSSMNSNQLTSAYLLLIPLSLLLASAIFKYIADLTQARLVAEREVNLRRELVRQVFYSPWHKVRMLNQGGITNGVVSEASQITNGLMAFLNSIGISVVILVFWISAYFVNWRMALVISSFILLTVIFFKLRVNKFRQVEIEMRHGYQRVSEKVSSLLAEIKFFRLSRQREFWLEEIGIQADLLSKARRKQLALPASNRVILETAGVVFLISSLGLMAITGIQLAEGLVFLGIFYRLVPRIQSLQGYMVISAGQQIWLRKWAERRESLDEPRLPLNGAIQRSNPILEPSSGLTIRVNDLIWQQSGSANSNALNFYLDSGEFVCVTGRTGAGKTTLVDTILGLNPFSSGTIKIDGEIIQSDDSQLFPAVEIVTQDVPIFDGTFKRNITSAFQLEESWFREVIRIANLEDLVRNLSDGFDTDISNKGLAMSGGEKQRLGIARAIYSKPRLLVIDEATNGLDSETERRIISGLRSLSWKPTILAISHRESLMGLSDRVLILDDGILRPKLEEGPSNDV